ncbi:hypothetical protein GGI07_005252 [Coemansia sp. Benny D115]|nr:hypothetical protein GGI07_005252 [Coemansia sp. Benny D115]
MPHAKGPLIVAALFGLLCAAANAEPVATGGLAGAGPHRPQLVPRATAKDLQSVKGGVLLKNGKQTSCHLGILDNQAALVSADCLTYKDGAVDRISTTYEAALDAGYDGASAFYTVQDITVHPSYDPDTKANNIAVIEFNTRSTIAWANYNAALRRDWSQLVFVQQSLLITDKPMWNTPQLSAQINQDDNQCSQYSDLYKANQKDYICSSSAMVNSPVGVHTDCRVPYPFVYAQIDNTLYPAGFLSHVAVKGGSDLCESSDSRVFYTIFSDYLMYASTVLNRMVYYYSADNVTEPQKDADYAMAKPFGNADDNITLIGGDIYARQAVSSTANSASASASATGSNAQHSESSDGSSSPTNKDDSKGSSSGSSGGLSKKNTITVAVCSAVGGLLIAVSLFFLVRWWRRHGKVGLQRDPYKETTAQQMLADDLGGASVTIGPVRNAATNDDQFFARIPPPPAYRDAGASGTEPAPLSPPDLSAPVQMPTPEAAIAAATAAVAAAESVSPASLPSPSPSGSPMSPGPRQPLLGPGSNIDHHGYPVDEKR